MDKGGAADHDYQTNKRMGALANASFWSSRGLNSFIRCRKLYD